MTISKNVLVVDDNADVCSLYAALLRARGYVVDTCRDADDALRHLAAQEYGAVVFEPSPAAGLAPLLTLLTRTHRLDEVIATTTESDPQFSAALASRGLFRILRKPLSPREFTDAVDACLQQVRG